MAYQELRAVAGHYFSAERPSHTLQPTALVHEAWLRLAPQLGTTRSENHVKACAALVMRHVLAEHARAHRGPKRGGDVGHVPLSVVGGGIAAAANEVELLVLDEALERLSKAYPRQARVVELKYFGGMEEAAIADVVGVSPSTVQADWRFARTWLRRELGPGGGGGGGGGAGP